MTAPIACIMTVYRRPSSGLLTARHAGAKEASGTYCMTRLIQCSWQQFL
jgi:hypothetical protein